MNAWWQGLSGLNQMMYAAAIVVSIPFLWQLLMAFVGLGHAGIDDLDTGPDAAAADAGSQDAVDTVMAFRLFSIRALLSFFALFFWAAALYLDGGMPAARAFFLAAVWGLCGMVSIALLLNLLPKLAHTGTRDLSTAVGSEAVVYLDIPAHGTGEVRAVVGGVVNYVKARSSQGTPIQAGTPVIIRQHIGQTTVAVEPVQQP